MPGYPIAWTELWEEFDPSAEGSPYTADEIASYLHRCRSQYAPSERAHAIRTVRLVASRSLTSRRFWLWEVVDDNEGQWFVVIGSGSNPFGSDSDIGRWIYAETNDDHLAADEFLDREIAQRS